MRRLAITVHPSSPFPGVPGTNIVQLLAVDGRPIQRSPSLAMLPQHVLIKIADRMKDFPAQVLEFELTRDDMRPDELGQMRKL